MNQRPEPATFIALTPTMRQLIENVVEDLLLLLDELDGDPDIEETGDESDGSYPEGGARLFNLTHEDAEDDDVSEDADTGIADDGGLMEQTHRLPSPA